MLTGNAFILKIKEKFNSNNLFNLRYNFLALIQVLIGLLNYFLIIKNFGISHQADSYYISGTIFIALNLFSSMFIEQFMYFYTDIKVFNKEDAFKFYNTVITLTFLFQTVFVLILIFSIDSVIKLFVFNIDSVRYELISKIILIQLFAFLLTPITSINNLLFNAEEKFSIPYIIQIIPSFFNLVTLIALSFSNNKDIILINYSNLLSGIIVFVTQILLLKKMNITYNISLYHRDFIKFLKNSISMRFGHNIHNFMIQPMITNILAIAPVGIASSYSYADKITLIVRSLVVGPSYNIMQSRMASYISLKKYQEIKDLVKNYLKSSLPPLTLLYLFIYLTLPFFLNYFFSDKIPKSGIDSLNSLFILLAVWNIIIIFESPFVQVLISSKDSKKFLFVNTIFIISFYLLYTFIKTYSMIYVIPLSLIISQIINFYIYSLITNSFLNNKIKYSNIGDNK